MSGNSNKPFPKYKCPVCGAISEAHKRVGNSMMQCMLCNVTDATSQFVPIDETNAIADLIKNHADQHHTIPPDVVDDFIEKVFAEKGPATHQAMEIGDIGDKGPVFTTWESERGVETFFETKLSDTETMRQFYPPQAVVEAVDTIHNFFVRDRGAKQWAYGPIQSRDIDTHPALASVGLTGFIGKDIRIEDVRRLAAAFQCIVVKHPTTTQLLDLVVDVAPELDAYTDRQQQERIARTVIGIVLRKVGLR
jgi:hypothetical protein